LAAILGRVADAAGNDRPLVLDIGPSKLHVGPQTGPKETDRVDLVRARGQDVEMQQERIAVVDPRAPVRGWMRREQNLAALPETKPSQQQVELFEFRFRAGDQQIDAPPAAATRYRRAADMFRPRRRQMPRNQPGDLSRDIRCPRIEVPANDRRLIVRPDDRLNFVEHKEGSGGAG